MASSSSACTSCTSSSSKKRPSPNYDHDQARLQKRLHRQSSDSTHQASVSTCPSSSHSCLAPAHPYGKDSPRGKSRLGSAQPQAMVSFLEEEYHDEVVAYMHEMDGRTRASVETIDVQPELQWYMRPYLIDFLIEIHQQYRLRPETLYLAVNIIDRYVSKRVVFKKHYQLVGCSALWIAAKFEDSKDRAPTVSELSKMCCGAYEESSFIQMEGHVLSTVDWKLGHPTCEAWLRLFSSDRRPSTKTTTCSAAEADEKTLQDSSPSPVAPIVSTLTGHLARFIMEISLFHRSYVGLRSAHIAAAALILSRFILGQPRQASQETKEHMPVVCLLDAHLGNHFSTISAVVIKKYSYTHYSRASTVVKEWYASGRRFRRNDAMLDSKSSRLLSSVVVHQRPACSPSLPGSVSTPELSSQSATRRVVSSPSNASLSSSVSTSHNQLASCHRAHLTPSSISSLSLDSSPTSSASSYLSSSASSPNSSRSSSILVESKRMEFNHMKDMVEAVKVTNIVAPTADEGKRTRCEGFGMESDRVGKENRRVLCSVPMCRDP